MHVAERPNPQENACVRVSVNRALQVQSSLVRYARWCVSRGLCGTELDSAESLTLHHPSHHADRPTSDDFADTLCSLPITCNVPLPLWWLAPLLITAHNCASPDKSPEVYT